MPDLYDTTLDVPTPVAAALLTDRNTGHRMTMQLWDHIESTAHHGARSQIGCLWAVEPVTRPGTVLVRSTKAPTRMAPWATRQTTERTELPPAGTAVDFHVTVAAMYTPRSDVPVEWRASLKEGANGTPRPPGQGLGYRNNKVPVPAERLDEWATAKLHRLGIDGTVTASPSAAARRKNALIHTAQLRVTAATSNPALHDTLRDGLGTSRAYGLGLVILQPTK